MRYRLTSDNDGHHFIIPADLMNEWEKHLTAFYKVSDAGEETPEEPVWAVAIGNPSRVTFENWDY